MKEKLHLQMRSTHATEKEKHTSKIKKLHQRQKVINDLLLLNVWPLPLRSVMYGFN